MVLHFFFVGLCRPPKTTAVEDQDRGCDSEAIQDYVSEPSTCSPQTSINLAGLKEAFSNHHATGIRSMQSSHKAVCGGPSQKKMYSFVSCSKKTPDVIRKPLTSLTTSLSSVKSYTACLDRFKSIFDSDADSGVPNQNSTKEDPEHGHDSVLPDSVVDENGVKTETLDEAVDTEFRSYDGLVPETKSEERIFSPEAKRARCEDGCEMETASLRLLDSPVNIQKKTVHLQFSFRELSKRIQRLQAQQREDSDKELKYRRFRAKINPGENQSAEDELKKEIRLCDDSVLSF